jgi:8-amino-7-oxononanoate synthase
LLQGVLLSGAKLLRFRHNDKAHLETLLQAQQGAHIIIVSESVFGMDGDRADLATLIALARTCGAMLYIDEAHATGVCGPRGFGLCANYKGQINIAMGTFGKALGSFGAYIACSQSLRDYLIQRCGGLIYSTALPPSVLGANLAALELVPQMDSERAYLQEQSARLRDSLRAQGWDCGASVTHIIPVILGGEDSALNLSERLAERGILAPAIRPPTVPRGSSRLRISLSTAHKTEDIDRLIAIMGEEAPHFAAPACAKPELRSGEGRPVARAS